MNRDAPVVMVTVREGNLADKRVDFEGRLIDFEFEDNARRADKCVITLDNFDLKYLDDSTWQRGQMLEVTWGYVNRMHNPQRVIIKRVSGGKKLRIEATAVSNELNKERRTRSFHGKTRSAIVRDVASEYGYRGSTLHVKDTSTEYETVNQVAETDAVFLRRLGKKEGFSFYVDSTGLHWHDEEYDASPTKTLTYYTDPDRGDILDFKMDSDLQYSPGRSQVKGINPKTKKAFDQSGSDKDTDRTELAEEIEIVDPRTLETSREPIKKRNATASVRNTPARDERDAKKEADARFKRASRSRIKLTLDIVGDPTITAKRTIDVKGLGEFLSGRYFIKVSRHKLSSGSGYAQTIQLRRAGPDKSPGKADRAGGRDNRKPENKETFERVDPRTLQTTVERRESGGS